MGSHGGLEAVKDAGGFLPLTVSSLPGVSHHGSLTNLPILQQCRDFIHICLHSTCLNPGISGSGPGWTQNLQRESVKWINVKE